MLEFVYSNIKCLEIARQNGIQGTVVIFFVVDNNGQIQDPEVVRDIRGEYGKADLKVIEMMADMEKKWRHRIKDSKAVNVQYNLPVRFTFNGEEEG